MSVANLHRGANGLDALRPLVFPMCVDVRSPEFWAEDRDGWPFWSVSIDVEMLDLDAFDDNGNMIADEAGPSDVLGMFLDAIDSQARGDDAEVAS